MKSQKKQIPQNTQVRIKNFGYQEVQFYDSLHSNWETYKGFENAQINVQFTKNEMEIECKSENGKNPLIFPIKSGTIHKLNGEKYSKKPSYVEWKDGNDKFRIKFDDYVRAKSFDNEIEDLKDEKEDNLIKFANIDSENNNINNNNNNNLIDSMKGKYFDNEQGIIAQARILGEKLKIVTNWLLPPSKQKKYIFTGDEIVEVANDHFNFQDGTSFTFEKNEDFKTSVQNSCSKKSEENELKNMTIEFLKQGCDYNGIELEKDFEMDSFHIYTEKDTGFIINKTRYYPPVGWIRLKMKNQGNKDVSKWSYGYHGTKYENIKSIVKNGLVIPGNKTQDGKIVEIRKGHIPNQNHIYSSQSYIYASHPIYALPVHFNYNNKSYFVRVMFQIRVDKVDVTQEHTIRWPDNAPIDLQVPNELLEWIIFSSDQIVPYGLLIKFDEEDPYDIFEKIKKERLENPNWSHRTTPKEIEKAIHLNKEASKEKKKKILWVDDEPENNKPIIEVARKVGLKITTVIDTEKAILEYQKNPEEWFLIISDMKRIEVRTEHPKEKKEYPTAGLSLTQSIRQINKDIPIWIYSQYTRTHPISYSICYQMGVSEVVNISRILTHFFPYDPIYENNDFLTFEGLKDFEDSSNVFLNIKKGQIFKVIVLFKGRSFVADIDNKTTGFIPNNLIKKSKPQKPKEEKIKNQNQNQTNNFFSFFKF
ncbi:hypothetical protein M0811_04489 [Anaeramoeba ignava]|uniref:Uncharacterized protein n=1 Tax=Anaeramoeba ignava TaxID=1746090 RepID=A0A9Q0RH59_ANAIG|nr:hypothetical protein M0811_04489 [Anaeramoeba ignava]